MGHTSNKQNFSRRNLLQFGAGLIGTGSLTAWLGSCSIAETSEHPAIGTEENPPAATSPKTTHTKATPAQGTHAQGTHPHSTLTPDQALEKLIEGNQRFVNRKRLNPHQSVGRLTEVASGQAPFAAILSCADSRVVPEIVFDRGIGDLFVVRVAGNIAITEDIASEEYAVGVLQAPLLMVLGHERCGAVAAALEGGEFPGVIESLVFAIRPAIQASAAEPGDRLTNAVKANIRLQVQRLQTSSVIAAAIEEGKLKIVGAYYDLDTGKVSLIS